MDAEITLTVDGHEQNWLLIRGDFEEEARAMRALQGDRIEAKRDARIILAVPFEDDRLEGLLCAFLPTEESLGLPFHLHANFFPSTDRKRVLFDHDFRGEWNLAAIKAAADAIANNLETLRDRMGATRLWSLFTKLEELNRDTGFGPAVKAKKLFWEIVEPAIGRSQVQLTSNAGWVAPGEAYYLTSGDEERARPLLDAVDRAAPSEACDLKAAPVWLRARASREALAVEFKLLEGRATEEEARQARVKLSARAIILANDGRLVPPSRCWSTDPATAAVFAPFSHQGRFNDADEPEALVELMHPFTERAAVDSLTRVSPNFDGIYQDSPEAIIKLIAWFAQRAAPEGLSSHVNGGLAALPMWPSAGTLRPLTNLSIPGEFEDPLGLADLIDLEHLKPHRAFIESLGVESLTLQTYIKHHVAKIPTGQGEVSTEKRRALWNLLVSNHEKLKGDTDVAKVLQSCYLVECEGGSWHKPGSVYQPVPELRKITPTSAVFMDPAVFRGAKEFAGWLGVRPVASMADLSIKIRELVTEKPSPERGKSVQVVFDYLAKHLHSFTTPGQDALKPLREFAWLPATGDETRWHVPAELYTTEKERLFFSQGPFLGFEHSNDAPAKLAEALGVNSDPTVQLVVAHLRWAVREKKELHRDVYSFLQGHIKDSAVLDLGDEPCLCLQDKLYAVPWKCVWSKHSLGSYRTQLGSEFREWTLLLSALGVQTGADDATAVLLEIESKTTPTTPLDISDHNVVLACWRLLVNCEESKHASLRSHRVIPNLDMRLRKPDEVFFEDRPHLAENFDPTFRQNVIKRPADCWTAMHAAGVRFLSEVVETKLDIDEDPQPAPTVTARLRERKQLFERIVASGSSESGADWDFSALERIESFSVKRLRAHYQADLPTQRWCSKSQDLRVYIDIEQPLLLFQGQEQAHLWTELARELVYGLSRGFENASLASAFRDALAPDTLVEAEQTLDLLGVVSLDASRRAQPEGASEPVAPGVSGESSTGMTPVAGKSTEGTPPGPTADEPASERAADGTHTQTVAEPGGVTRVRPSDHGGAPGNGASEQGNEVEPSNVRPNATMGVEIDDLGNGTGDEGEDDSGGDQGSREGATGRNRGNGTRPGRFTHGDSYLRRPGGQSIAKRLVSYVEAGDPDDEVEDDSYRDDAKELREAALTVVEAYERDHGRSIVESRPFGEPVDLVSSGRHIKVRGLSGPWGKTGVGLTRRQFDYARDKNGDYWLYVVENVNDQPIVTTIRSPFGQVTSFMFDSGWKEAAAKHARATSAFSRNAVPSSPTIAPPPPGAPTGQIVKAGREWFLDGVKLDDGEEVDVLRNGVWQRGEFQEGKLGISFGEDTVNSVLQDDIHMGASYRRSR